MNDRRSSRLYVLIAKPSRKEMPQMSADAARLTLPQPRSWLRVPSLPRRRAEPQFEQPAAQPLDLTELLAPDRWTPRRHTDPELRKALGVIQGHLSETRRLLALPKVDAVLRDAAAVRELTSLVQRDPSTLEIDGTWELAGALKRLNLRFGDTEFFASRLAYEQCRGDAAGQWHGWNAHFNADELRGLLNVFTLRKATRADHARAVDRLTSLYLLREEAGRDRRARAALKRLYLTRLAPVLLILLAGFALAVNVATGGEIWETILLTACAGGLGSTLSGIFKVRDQLVRLDELRSFWPAMRVQPLIGACAGLILFLVLQSNAISLGSASSGGWSGRGLLAFVAGFSEPFFLGIVQRVAVVSDRPATAAKAAT
jgi:hypothetical protein